MTKMLDFQNKTSLEMSNKSTLQDKWMRKFSQLRSIEAKVMDCPSGIDQHMNK